MSGAVAFPLPGADEVGCAFGATSGTVAFPLPGADEVGGAVAFPLPGADEVGGAVAFPLPGVEDVGGAFDAMPGAVALGTGGTERLAVTQSPRVCGVHIRIRWLSGVVVMVGNGVEPVRRVG